MQAARTLLHGHSRTHARTARRTVPPARTDACRAAAARGRRSGNVYLLSEDQGTSRFYKIGCSSNVEQRKRVLQVANPRQINVVCVGPWLEDMYAAEDDLHRLFCTFGGRHASQVSRQRLGICGGTEWFKFCSIEPVVARILNPQKE